MTFAAAAVLLTFAPLATGQTPPPRPFSFANDITPILNRYLCNTSGCHGSAEGQNGFKLSVFGADPVADFDALVKDARGRRVSFSSPEDSLLIKKAAGTMPHGGGIRLRAGTPVYDKLLKWVADGAPFGDPKAPHVAAIRIEPKQRLMKMGETQQLKVIAKFIDGAEIDVTEWAQFRSNAESMAGVDENGLVTIADIPGEVAVMATYLGEVDSYRALVPRPQKVAFPNLPETNVIDKHLHARLRQLNILPSPQADDATFLRRAYLDVIGAAPTLAETRAFLDDKRADKREKLIDSLLERPEYADYWTMIWSDVLRIDRQVLGAKRAYAFHRWVHANLAANKPFDQFAKEVLTAEGPLDDVGPANFFKAASKPGEAAAAVAQVFLGVRIACAECHHHPYDRWTQTDYYGMQSFFTPLSLKKTERGELLEATGQSVSKHPRTGEAVYSHPLGTPMPEANPAGDRRLVLASWMASPENPFFAKNIANRLWSRFFGRGLIEPVDDVRDTNPPSNPELLDALTNEVRAAKFDLKKVIRLIMTSQAYQRSSQPLPENEKDESNFSRALFRPIPAEVLLDMVSQSTGIEERFKGMPAGSRAVQLWDSKTQHYFLKLFGRPQRTSTCTCERVVEPSVAQVLHLFNSPEIQAKLSHDGGVVAKLVAARANDADLVNDMYLSILSRPPTPRERDRAVSHLANHADERRQAAEDLAWSLMNTLEFVFNH